MSPIDEAGIELEEAVAAAIRVYEIKVARICVAVRVDRFEEGRFQVEALVVKVIRKNRRKPPR